MKAPEKKLRRWFGQRGFSLVEVMVASGIAATVVTAAALVISAVGMNQRRLSTYGSIEIGAPAADNYYGLTGLTVDAYEAPNYGRAVSADLLRERFWEDVSHASAVYCMARTGLNTVRPVYVPLDNLADGRALDSPEAFRAHLATVLSQSTTVYQSWRGSSNFDNGSIYILQPSGFSDFLAVRAIYDIDIQNTSKPAGTYVSVKRYSWNVLTDYYDVFYRDGTNNAVFKPLFVFHERRARLSQAETAYDKYKTAADMPFYMIWWPDPAVGALNSQGASSTDSLTTIPTGVPNPLPDYAPLAGRTSYFFTVPLFPSM